MTSYTDWKEKTLKVTNLYLDPDNIRLDLKNKTQDALISDLFANENTMQILEGIAKYGFFPDELPLVVKDNNKWVVLEGNRRVAALKAIINPHLVPGYESKIKKILSSAIPIQEIQVVVAPNRSKALQLLANKHTKVTRKRWQPLRQAYFYYAQYKNGKSIKDLMLEYSNVNIQKFIKMWEMHKIAKSIKYEDKEVALQVFDQRKFPVSTLERLYDDPVFRKLLNFQFDKNGKVQIFSEINKFKETLKNVIEDAINKDIDTRSLNKDSERKKYLSKLNALPTKSGEKITINDFEEEKQPVRDDKYFHLAPKDINVSLKSVGIKKMLLELQNINYRRFPIASHDLLRSFLECSLKAYFEYKSYTVPKDGYFYLSDVLIAFSDAKNGLANTQYRKVTERILNSASMAPYSKGFLDSTNHNPSIFPNPDEVREAWDMMEDLLRYILDPK